MRLLPEKVSIAFAAGSTVAATAAAVLIDRIIMISGLQPLTAVPVIFMWIFIFAMLGGQLAEWVRKRHAERGGD